MGFDSGNWGARARMSSELFRTVYEHGNTIREFVEKHYDLVDLYSYETFKRQRTDDILQAKESVLNGTFDIYQNVFQIDVPFEDKDVWFSIGYLLLNAFRETLEYSKTLGERYAILIPAFQASTDLIDRLLKHISPWSNPDSKRIITVNYSQTWLFIKIYQIFKHITEKALESGLPIDDDAGDALIHIYCTMNNYYETLLKKMEFNRKEDDFSQAFIVNTLISDEVKKTLHAQYLYDYRHFTYRQIRTVQSSSSGKLILR